MAERAGRALPPQVFHLADDANLAAIERDGLLSAARLIERSPPSGRAPRVTMRMHRNTSLCLPDGTLIRDQKPMPPAALEACLADGVTPADWYAHLNGFVFFWLDKARVERHVRACGGRPQTLLMFDTSRLLARHADRAFVTAFNTGNARRQPAPRGLESFVPYARWLEAGWEDETMARPGRMPRPLTHRPVELAIEGQVTDAWGLAVQREAMAPQ